MHSGGFFIGIVLVYLASDDKERDDEIEVEIVRILNNISLEEIPYVLMGDFNSHLGFIGPQPMKLKFEGPWSFWP